MKSPQTLQEAIVYFSDPERAFVYAVNLRWPTGKVACPRCDCKELSFTKTRLIWFCKGCKRQFSVKVGTIFEDSALSLDKWMTAVWMIVNCKNGISSHELARALGITQKSAWFMLHRVREALHVPAQGSKLGGGSSSELEADETFIGGKVRNMHADRRLRFAQQGGIGAKTGKTVVMGILDRSTRQMRAAVVPDVKRETLQNQILKNVKYGSTIYTDDAVAYDKLKWRFVHDCVNHAERYVNGRVHTNGLENFWSLLKRGLAGTYVAVEPFHLDRYVDEQVFRFNNRKDMSDADRFQKAMYQINHKRLTYETLTGRSNSPHHDSAGAW